MPASFDRELTDAVPQLQGRKRRTKCLLCGVRSFVQLICNACGRGNRVTAAFAATARRPARFRGIFVVEHEPSASSAERQRGEYKRLTVLFADIRNSTSLIDSWVMLNSASEAGARGSPS